MLVAYTKKDKEVIKDSLLITLNEKNFKVTEPELHEFLGLLFFYVDNVSALIDKEALEQLNFFNVELVSAFAEMSLIQVNNNNLFLNVDKLNTIVLMNLVENEDIVESFIKDVLISNNHIESFNNLKSYIDENAMSCLIDMNKERLIKSPFYSNINDIKMVFFPEEIINSELFKELIDKSFIVQVSDHYSLTINFNHLIVMLDIFKHEENLFM